MSIEDLLIDFDEMGFAPTTPCQNPNEYACEWKRKLVVEINRQKSEIEKLTSLVDECSWDFCSIAGCEGASNDCWKTCPDSRYNKIKNKAIREFAEKLHDKAHYSEDFNEMAVYCFDIDNLVKEMAGDTE